MKKTIFLFMFVLGLVIGCGSTITEPAASLPETNAGTDSVLLTTVDEAVDRSLEDNDSTKSMDVDMGDEEMTSEMANESETGGKTESNVTNRVLQGMTPTPNRRVPSGGGDGGETVPFSESFIRFRRTGGMAGLDDTWTFYADGRVIDNQGNAGRIDNATLAEMWSIIESGEYFTYSERYLPKNTCCDLFTYELTVSDGGLKMHTVTTMEMSTMPAGLQNLLLQINSYLAQQPPTNNYHDAPLQ